MVHRFKITRVFAAVAVAVTLLEGCNCGRNPSKEAQRDIGEDCDGDDRCKSGLCDAIPGSKTGAGKVCVLKCTSGCGTTEVCINLGPNRFGCAPEREGLCSACSDDSQCPYPGDRCIAISGKTYCGRDCAFDNKCPPGFSCQNAFSPGGDQVPAQCQPLSGTCACTPANVGQVVPCEHMNGFGVCMGVKTCQQTTYSECVAPTPMAEICNGLDDDCNGSVDDGMGVISCGTGECKRTVPACADGGVSMACTPGGPIAETCNEKDDDCDGVVDNGWDKLNDPANCGLCGTVCAAPRATTGCDGGGCDIVRCDPGYGNCNRVYADGCEADLTQDNANCGVCGRVCNLPGTNGTCIAGNCQGTCLPGYIDLDMNPANGCEYQCTFVSSIDLPDLGFADANCDGIDGEVANGIFVTSTGLDSNPGTRAAPKKTITAGLAAAVSQNKRDVYVAAGTYFEQVSMVSNKGLYGGYLPTSWSRAVTNVSTVTGFNAPLTMSGVTNPRVQLMTFIGSSPTNPGETAYGGWISLSTNVSLEGVTLRAGNGVPGSPGNIGTTGSAGSAGQIGQDGCEDSSIVCNSCGQPQGGAGGTSACGRSGGRGGSANRSNTDGNGGSPGVGGTSGGLGVPWGQGNFTPQAPYVGVTGAKGPDGAAGTPGPGYGSVTMTGYVLAVAGGGSIGIHGNGGGGGGGGGGGNTNCDSYGGGGGGGGAGGCAGGGGFPGMSGGASIALFLWSSSVTSTQSTILSGNGGAGGRGGAGGVGGSGGPGGVAPNGAGNNYGGSNEQDDGSNGGRGGRGGNGGNGGEGGGGGGGPSIGVLRGGTSTWTSTNVSYTLGAAGMGGPSSGGQGANGLRMNVYP